jgi:hypothetical protein
MTILNVLPLAATEAHQVPETNQAVYILWRGKSPFHAGCITDSTQSLRDRFMAHVLADGDDTSAGATHFSYELTDQPLMRLVELGRILRAASRANGVVRAGEDSLPGKLALSLDPELTLPPSANKSAGAPDTA